MELWLVPKSEVEGGVAGSGVNSGVEGVLCDRQPLNPVVPPLAAEGAEVGLDLLVEPLRLAVCLRVVCRGQRALDPKTFEDPSEQVGCKLWAAVGDDLVWKAMQAEVFSNEDVRRPLRIDLLVARDQVR